VQIDVDVVIQSLGISAGPEIIVKPTRLFLTPRNLTKISIGVIECWR
jgi:hypothetical protein